MKKVDLKKVFKDALVISKLMEEKDKIDNEDIVQFFPDGVTLSAVDRIFLKKDDKEEEVWVYNFVEKPEVFAYAGTILAKLFRTGLGTCGGDLELLNENIRGVKIRLTEGINQQGDKMYIPEIV